MKKVGLVIGHNDNKTGCKSPTHLIKEYYYNKNTVFLMQKVLLHRFKDMRSYVFLRVNNMEYPDEMNELAYQVKDMDLVISFHCNSASSTSATGHETWIYPNTSLETQLAAELLNNGLGFIFGNKDRGVKKRYQGNKPENRGWQYHYYLKPPAILLEPGFFSNEEDSELLIQKQKVYIEEMPYYIKSALEVYS